MSRHPAHPAVVAHGFTLTELLISMTVLAILASIAIPAYQSYSMQANRTDAIKTLTYDRQVLERCYSQNFSYLNVANDCPGAVNIVGPSQAGKYNITVNPWTATSYQLNAAPAGTQTHDTTCTLFTVTQNGTQTATGSSGVTTQTCWGSTN
ncbi:MAG TPA: type IV pilin protein [Steroidobacteraceae bacterium]|nr:type IV pilin protein [Steroidobacteraceae bacterium]